MVERYFTVDEATEALVEVRPLAERMAAAATRAARLQETVRGNGTPAARLELEREARAVAECIERLQELGVLVKDPMIGLVDFPAVRDGEPVLLCWKAGEETLGYWHGWDEGFAGRKPLPL